MRCIFCKIDSSASKSVEHIIPESLGNKDHVLPRGIVCDACNQYFALKIEKPILQSSYFQNLRHNNDVESKKKRIPLGTGILGGLVYIDKSREGRSIIVNNPNIIKGIQDGTIKHMIVPIIDMPNTGDNLLPRFIGKIAFEGLVYRLMGQKFDIDSIVDEPELESIRQYIRFGNKPLNWMLNCRRIYPEGALFKNEKVHPDVYEVLHEFEYLATSVTDLFGVIVIMGVEYVINLLQPNIAGYQTWLKENNNASPVDEERIIVSRTCPNWQSGDSMRFVTTNE